ncbi:MAG: DUF2231 domain-containing protein [Caldilineae bacterium]|nr:MAG: DUF2231 domain-containing protein [Caldilineae bacterium]
MFGFLSTLTQDLHPMVVHFPIALFTLSFVLALAGRIWPRLREMEWLLFALGTLAALAAVVTGLAAHFPYENTDLAAIIEPHQFSALLGTLVMLGIAIGRFVSRRRGKDIGQQSWYLVFAVLGLVWIVLVGGTGGQLVYQYAVNVRGVNPLLP